MAKKRLKILVTGGTGVIGEGLIPLLLEAGHAVRILSRGAADDARQWPAVVEPFVADVTDPKALRGAAKECGAVIHITGIIKESPPEVTFERVNVKGTKNVLSEAVRSGVRRFIYVSSLGAERGSSDYHRSKRHGEKLVAASKTDWLILRPGNVYGPGDEVISSLLKLIRTLPAVPVIDGGEQPFQPIWYQDLGRALLQALEKPELKRQTLELAGNEVTTTNNLIERIGKITDRNIMSVPVPSFLAAFGVQIADIMNLEEILGIEIPLNDSKLRMLLEENVIERPESNALTGVFGIRPTPLDEGLRLLADMIPEQLSSDGVGSFERKRFWADIKNSLYSPEELLKLFRLRCAEVMPLEFNAEPDTPQAIEEGATLTMAVPWRGNVQVRVEEVTSRRITFSTIQGHMLAGTVRFNTSRAKRYVRFMIEIHARAANRLDLMAMRLIGDSLQSENWEEVVSRVVELSEGSAPKGVQSEIVKLDDDEAKLIEQQMEELVNRRKRGEREIIGKHAQKSVGRSSAARKRETQKTRSKALLKKGARKTVPKNRRRERAVATSKPGTRKSELSTGDVVPKAVDAVSSLATSVVRGAAKVAARTLGTSGNRNRARKARKAVR